MGTYAELKNLQITVNMVNTIKKRRKITLAKPAGKQTAESQAVVPTEKRSIHSACLGFL